MCTRLVINVTQIYLPFLLIDTLNASDGEIATVPLVTYLAGYVNLLQTLFYILRIHLLL